MVRRSGVLKEITAVNSRNQLSGHTTLNDEFSRIKRLPPYIFNIVGELKAKARAQGEDIIDFSMGNPDQPTPQHIVVLLFVVVLCGVSFRYSVSFGFLCLCCVFCFWFLLCFVVVFVLVFVVFVFFGSLVGLVLLVFVF